MFWINYDCFPSCLGPRVIAWSRRLRDFGLVFLLVCLANGQVPNSPMEYALGDKDLDVTAP